MSEPSRRLRVAALLRQELAALLRYAIEDPRLRGVAVTDVEVTPDLALAKVYLGVADDDAARRALQGAAGARGFLRRRLAAALRLRAVPKLVFAIDPAFVAATRIEELLAGEGRVGSP